MHKLFGSHQLDLMLDLRRMVSQTLTSGNPPLPEWLLVLHVHLWVSLQQPPERTVFPL